MTMRKKANLSLLLLAALFICAAAVIYYYPGHWWTRLLLFAAEAGLVGALADLFAVTVLFRHPLGIKLPHTAIIPRNRDKLVDGVVQMVENQLLSKGFLKAKLSQLSMVDALIRWVESLSSPVSIMDRGWAMLVSFLDKLDKSRLSERFDQHLKKSLLEVEVSRYAGRGLKWMLAQGDFHKWLTLIIDYAAERVSGEETKQAIREMIEKEKSKFVNEGGAIARWFKQKLLDFAESTDAINLDEAVETLHNDLLGFMVELRNPEHELRKLLFHKLHELGDNLEQNEDIAASIESWKSKLLEELSFAPAIQALLETVMSIIGNQSDTKYVMKEEKKLRMEDVKQWLTGLLISYWEWFKADERTKDQLERYLQQFVTQVIETEHAVIGKIVRHTLDGFTEERLVSFIEGKVEIDLQRIRLNGAFIGAAVGGLMFLFLYGVYKPLLDWL
ncbi:DUF445 domain-containing protein [Paenibacillus sp. HB172176]|uniref:DUF445 domain-containing protein n=1 Tax=Paenibacillus sp. HB172176 TaxID=2493690 RepID=UPI001438A1D9|nr:DUF445 domain-containing protein [Paenibacillus sp. HB172176]